MSSDSEFSNSNLRYVFLKRIKDGSTKKSSTDSIVSDYKILLIISMIGGLPFSPCQLLESNEPKACFVLVIFVSAVFHVCRTLVCIFTTYFSYVFLPAISLVMTFNIFNWCSLIASWILFFKRGSILYAMRTTISTVEQVNSTKFQSGWNIRFILLLFIVGISSISSTVFSITLSSTKFIHTPVMFLWYEVHEEYYDILMRAVSISVALTYTFSAFTCGLVVLISSTMYFHLGDVILNFGNKLKKRFRHKVFSPYAFSANMAVFQKTIHLNQAVNDAVSTSVVFFYGASIACFFKAASLAITYGTQYLELFLLVVFAFVFAMATFFLMTVSGNRVRKKSQQLRESSIECSRIAIASDPEGSKAICFSLMIEGIKAMEFSVTGGEMFVITNHLVLTVAGVLITYGVLIFQQD